MPKTDTMKQTVPYLQWRDEMRAGAENGPRIGDDLLILKKTGKEQFNRGPFRIDMTLAVFLERGCCRFMTGVTSFEAKSPCMFIVIPGQIFQLEEMSDDARPYTIIMSRRFSEQLFMEYGGSSRLLRSITRDPVVDLTEGLHVFSMYLKMLEGIVRSPVGKYRLEAAVHLTLSMYYGYSYRLHERGDTKPGTRQAAIVSEFESLLRLNYMHRRDVGFYASRLCITPKYLSAVVKQETGKSALRCIEEYVAMESKALLLSTGMNIQQISDRLNFPSQSVFGKFFKRVTGFSPREFRASASKHQ